MATWYVSNEASNGYTVGHDTTGNGSAALPYITLDKAMTMAANTGDTIYMNGALYTVNTFAITKAVNLQPVVPYGTTLKTSSTDRGLSITHAFGGTNTVGAFIIDCAGVDGIENTALGADIGIRIYPSAVKFNIVLSGTRIINVKKYGVGCTSGTLSADITFSNDCRINTITAAAGYTSGVLLSALGAGVITCTGTAASPGLTITSTGVDTASSQGVIIYANATTGVSLNLAGLVINTTMSANNLVKTHYGVLAKNIPAPSISNSSFTMTTAQALHRFEGIQITNSSATYNSIGAVVDNVTMALTSANTGHAVLIGEETPDGILDNLTDNAIIRNCTITGSDAAATAGYHGLMLGNNRNGQMYGNTVSRVAIGLLTKEGTGHIVYNNVTSFIPSNGQHLRAKAATTNFYSNTCNAATGYAGTFISNTENDGATRFSASTFRRNKLLNPNNIAMQALNCPIGNTAYMFNNTYQGTGVLSFVYWATTYASLSLFKAAHIEKIHVASHSIRAISGARRIQTSRSAAVYTSQ